MSAACQSPYLTVGKEMVLHDDWVCLFNPMKQRKARKCREKLHRVGRKKKRDMFNAIKEEGREMHREGSKTDEEKGGKG